MGLDMMIYKIPRYKDTTAEQANALENYFQWTECIKNGTCNGYTMEQWCGIPYERVPLDNAVTSFYFQIYKERGCILDEVAYWRKTNHIHRWFVENVQDGEDDCRFHHELTEQVLKDLVDVCKQVMCSCHVVEIDGERVIDCTECAEELLPTQSGCFFGNCSYNELYISKIEYTIEQIERLLEETDFEKEMLYYLSSW